MKGEEFELHKKITNFIASNWPEVQYRSDLGGLLMGWKSAKEVKEIQKSKAWPDLFIARPVLFYAGLFIELKVSVDELFTKDGKWRKGKSYTHIYEQRDCLLTLRRLGYCAEFGCGLTSTKDLIEWYMSLPSDGPYESASEWEYSMLQIGITY